ncbi:CG14512 [Drosophila busckii]|uniref:UDP-N-acetylglucosamine transferase subunit ALG13 n=1 Tax=Drosophila busckii TaxID=30019 RepID=A0A0M3QYI1_DROBS|nr:UDP-N-acetylglucosamine transferase subunit ALG13 homolog [Drosophila busckii]ALC47659.1 CG14512 [Drosophila busckii]
MQLNVVYVTVGTTRFDALINSLTSHAVLSVLQARQCHKLIVQHGNSLPLTEIQLKYIEDHFGIQVEQYTFRPNIEDIRAADLIIGHAGAGTCTDILHNGKAGLIVINDELMDNHQVELALQLASEHYMYYCTVDQLSVNIATLAFEALKPYELNPANMQKLITALDDLMKF